MKDLDSRINLIRKKIELIASQSSKKISFNPPISEKEIAEIEQYYQITFPSEYRAFLTKIGNGGFSSYYGLLSLQDSLEYFHNLTLFCHFPRLRSSRNKIQPSGK